MLGWFLSAAGLMLAAIGLFYFVIFGWMWWEFAVYISFPAGVLGTVSMLIGWRLIHAFDRGDVLLVQGSEIIRDAACSRCGYNLKGLLLDATCPECGQIINHWDAMVRYVKSSSSDRSVEDDLDKCNNPLP